jgi:uncharacterized RDD family membrane protein YckC
MSPYGELADWATRAQSAVVDWFGPGVIAGVFYQANTGLGLIVQLAALGWALYNAYLGGETGQSYGKKWAGTRVVDEETGQNIGGGKGIIRHIAHILDAIICYIGFLFPLWDVKRQTIADKVVKTLVVKV